MELADLELVLAIRSHHGMAAAGRALGLAPSVVTKRLGALEARLGQRLFHRSTRHVEPTAEGLLLCERATAVLEAMRTLREDLRDRLDEPAGPLRVAATFGFGRQWVARCWPTCGHGTRN